MHRNHPWGSKHPNMVSQWWYIDSILISKKNILNYFRGIPPKCPKILICANQKLLGPPLKEKLSNSRINVININPKYFRDDINMRAQEACRVDIPAKYFGFQLFTLITLEWWPLVIFPLLLSQYVKIKRKYINIVYVDTVVNLSNVD